MEKLHSYRYLDDERLSMAFVNDKKHFSKKGPRYIASVLKTKGVDQETINEALANNYQEDEALENCRALVYKKLDYYKRKTEDQYTLKGKLYGFLAQRGYGSEVIKKAIEEVLREDEA